MTVAGQFKALSRGQTSRFVCTIYLFIIFNRTQSTKDSQTEIVRLQLQSCSDYVHIPAIMSVIWDFVKVKLSGNTL